MEQINIADLLPDDLFDLLEDLSDVGLEGRFADYNVHADIPEAKDIKRAKDFAYLPGRKWAGGPLDSKAHSQSLAIEKIDKLIRRSKACVAVWGTGDHETVKGTSNPWQHFRKRLLGNGFSGEQIRVIESYTDPRA